MGIKIFFLPFSAPDFHFQPCMSSLDLHVTHSSYFLLFCVMDQCRYRCVSTSVLDQHSVIQCVRIQTLCNMRTTDVCIHISIL